MKHVLLAISLLFICTITAQQNTQYSQWFLHQFSGNAAHAGIKECVDLHSVYRHQWTAFPGAPRSGFFTASMPLRRVRSKYMGARHGTGLKFEYDKIGNFSFNRLNAAYAGHFNFTEHRRLSLGLFAGIVHLGYDPSKATTAEPDPAVMNELSLVAPDASFGAWFNDENYFVGASLDNLIPIRWSNLGTQSAFRFHAKLNAGYRLKASNTFTILPVGMVRLPPKGPISADLSLLFDYKDVFGFGLGYRNTDAVMGFISLKIQKQFSIIYSFDYTLSDIQLGAKNTHEIGLSFTTCRPRNTGSLNCSLFQ